VQLHAIDVAHSLAALDQLRREVRDADVTRQSFIYELRHGGPGLLDGDLRIRQVDLIEVEYLAAQAAQASFRARPYAGRIEATAERLEYHLGEDHDVVPPGDCLAHQLLRAARAVRFGGVHPAHAVLKGGAHRPYQLLVGGIDAMIATAGLPGSVADEGDLRPILAELAPLHGPLGAGVPLFRHGTRLLPPAFPGGSLFTRRIMVLPLGQHIVKTTFLFLTGTYFALIHRESEKGYSRKLGFRYRGFSEVR
jgi:hypothetical protein